MRWTSVSQIVDGLCDDEDGKVMLRGGTRNGLSWVEESLLIHHINAISFLDELAKQQFIHTHRKRKTTKDGMIQAQ